VQNNKMATVRDFFILLCGGDNNKAVGVSRANVGTCVDRKYVAMFVVSVAVKFNSTNVMAVPIFQAICYQLNVGI
jgi:hypothetical protein